jgi:DNA-binding NtrC family response regulator
MLVEVLTHHGYTVLGASRGAAALALAEKTPIDLLATDMSMPGMSGWDLAKCLRSRHPGLPVLLMSGYDEHETACWGRMDPPIKHLFKPFSLDTFLRESRQLLDYKRKNSPLGPPERQL